MTKLTASKKQAVWEAATICPRSCKLTFDPLTLKVASESRVTWATSVPILVFLGLSVIDLGLMYATDVSRQTCIIAQSPLPRGGSIKCSRRYMNLCKKFHGHFH